MQGKQAARPRDHSTYLWYRTRGSPTFPPRRMARQRGVRIMSETGLQKLSFALLIALILYVSVAGGV